MKIHEIKNLNYSLKENRILLVRNVMDILKLEEVPDEIYLRKVVEKLQIKYHYTIRTVVCSPDSFDVSIRTDGDSYTILSCKKYKEFLLKYILLVKELNKIKKNEEKMR